MSLGGRCHTLQQLHPVDLAPARSIVLRLLWSSVLQLVVGMPFIAVRLRSFSWLFLSRDHICASWKPFKLFTKASSFGACGSSCLPAPRGLNGGGGPPPPSGGGHTRNPWRLVDLRGGGPMFPIRWGGGSPPPPLRSALLLIISELSSAVFTPAP